MAQEEGTIITGGRTYNVSTQVLPCHPPGNTCVRASATTRNGDGWHHDEPVKDGDEERASNLALKVIMIAFGGVLVCIAVLVSGVLA